VTAIRDPRQLSEVFGQLRRDEDGGLRVGQGRTEAHLRRGLASAAHAYGWLVEEEVVVPNWGRIDIVLRDGRNSPVLIELKLDLTRPAKIRHAFQQTDGYGRWWAQERSEAADTILVGARVDSAAVSAVHRAYPQVGWCNAGGLFAELKNRGDEQSRLARRRRCFDRLLELRALSSAYEAALAKLPPDPDFDMLGSLRLFDQFFLGKQVTA
jgi:hypothetical protein